MTLLLGFLLVVAALIAALLSPADEAETRTPMCPSCGIRRLSEYYEGPATYYDCALCQKRYKRGVDGMLVRA